MQQPEADEQVLSRQIRQGLPAAVLATPAPPLPRMSGRWRIRLLRPGGADARLLVAWMGEPHVVRFWEQNWPAERWNRYLRAQIQGEYARPALVLRDGRPFAYVEIYRAARDLVGQYYPAQPHDLGVHLAIGDLQDTGQGLGRAMIREVAHGLLAADPRCRQVVAEPDARNQPARRMFQGAGFQLDGEIQLPHKPAALMVLRRA